MCDDRINAKIREILVQCFNKKDIKSTDNFFEMGGNSIISMKMALLINAYFSCNLSFHEILDNPTISELVDIIKEKRSLPDIRPDIKYSQQSLHHTSASYAQKLWWRLIGKTLLDSSYIVPAAFILHGSVNVEALEKSVHSIISKHASLRTYFRERKGNLITYIGKVKAAYISEFFFNKKNNIPLCSVKNIIIEKIKEPFNLFNGPLIRVSITHLDENKSLLFINIHHIVYDEVSRRLLYDELSVLYEQFCKKTSPLTQKSERNCSCISDQCYDLYKKEKFYEKEKYKNQINYWKDNLENITCNRKYYFKTESNKTYLEQISQLGKSLIKEIDRYCSKKNISRYVCLMAAFHVALYQYTNKSRQIVLSIISQRPCVNQEKNIGLHINILPIISKIITPISFDKFIDEISSLIKLANKNSDIHIESLYEQHGIDIIELENTATLNYINEYEENKKLKLYDLHVENYELQEEMLQLGYYKKDSIDMFLVDNKGEIKASLRAANDIVKKTTLVDILHSFTDTLNCIASDPYGKIVNNNLLKIKL